MAAPKREGGSPRARISLFYFVPKNYFLRDAVEIFFSSLPGAALLAVFILGVGGLTISFNTTSFAASYIPVVCLLPLVVGIITPLILERIRGQEYLSLRRAMAASMLAGLAGSTSATAILALLGAVNDTIRPFGPAISSLPLQLFLDLLIVVLCTGLSAAGGAIVILFIQKVSVDGGA